jgi:hypothetical protein
MSQTKPHITLYDKSFNKNNAASYQLYIELSEHGLSQTILDLSSKTFISLETYKFEPNTSEKEIENIVKELISSNPIYKIPFKQCKVSFTRNSATLIPNAVYDSTKLAEYHKFNFAVNKADTYLSDKLINLGAANVYSCSSNLLDLFKELHNVSFMHFSSALIETALITSKQTKSLSSIFVNVLESSFQLTIIKNQKLNLYNSFNYQTEEDFIYYLLFVLDQHNINNEEAILYLTGQIEKNSELYSQLYEYIHTLNFGERTANLKFSYILEEISHHSHYTLFNQFICE